jgi:glycosyltransferase involved in cell wall biosynthesis
MKLFLSHANSSEVIGGVEVYSGFMKRVFPDIKFLDYHSLISDLGDSINPFFREPERAKRLGEFVEKNFSDIETIFTNGMFCWNIKGIPQINICHGTYRAFAEAAVSKLNPDYYRLSYIYSYFEKIAAANSSKIIANSSMTASNVSKFFGRKAEIIYPPVDLEVFSAKPKEFAKKKLGWQGTNALFVGRPERAKGFHFIENLAKKNPGIGFRCILSRQYTPEIPNIYVYQNVPHSKLPLFYNACDVVVFPSLFEGCGLVILEALSLNKKVVCFKTGIAQEIDSDNLAISLPSADSLNENLQNCLNSKNSNSRKIIKSRFSFEKFKKEWKNAINSR